MVEDIEEQFADWEEQQAKISSTTTAQVQKVLSQGYAKDEAEFATLISPAAATFLPQLLQRSQQLTVARFGKTVGMYLPMYLSNECQNICTYCGFSLNNNIPRTTLTDAQILSEGKLIYSQGYRTILLVTGEANKMVGVDYLLHAVQLLKPFFPYILIEVQPLEEEEYIALVQAGLYGVLVYQETYNKEAYATYHPKGKKKNYGHRLRTPDRVGAAGALKIGIGVLLGLADWRTDSLMCARHLLYLKRKFWGSSFSLSFPRLRPAEGYNPVSVMDDKDLLQLISAYRWLDPDLELSISTREEPHFRDNIFKYGITSMSAGSKTNPGGYGTETTSLEQFEVHDGRSTAEMVEVIAAAGYEAVWKNWDNTLSAA